MAPRRAGAAAEEGVRAGTPEVARRAGQMQEWVRVEGAIDDPLDLKSPTMPPTPDGRGTPPGLACLTLGHRLCRTVCSVP